MEIQKIFSNVEDEGEKLYSVLMTEDEVALYSEMIEELQMYSDKKDEPKLKTGDKVGIWAQKHLNTKKDREAVIEGYGEGKWHKYGKRAALGGGVGSAIAGGIGGAMFGGAKGAALGAASMGAIGAASSYAGARLGGALRNTMAKHSGSVHDENQRIADRARVANGDMTKKQYAKKHNKK